jgi:hypothetical protein
MNELNQAQRRPGRLRLALSLVTRGHFKTLYDGLPRPSNLEILEKRRPWKAIVQGFETASSHSLVTRP